MVNFIVLAIVALPAGLACRYLYRAKKRGVKCIGCPSGCSCHGACGGCHSEEP